MQIYNADQIVIDFLKYVRSRGDRKLVVFLSGGSLVSKVQEIAYRLLRSEGLDNVIWALVDERYAEYSHHEHANFTKLAQLTGIDLLQYKGLTLQPVLTEGLNLHQTAAEYAKFVEAVINDSETQKLAILGIGEDFHIAGILPHRLDFTDNFYTQTVVGYSADEVAISDNPYRERITLSFSALKDMQDVWLYAVGEKKKSVINELLSSNSPTREQIAKQPGLYLQTLSNVTLYTDQAA
jgi:6-phosphogluconolactonase/glucosamine-6-phosphate isomerase/deaminase